MYSPESWFYYCFEWYIQLSYLIKAQKEGWFLLLFCMVYPTIKSSAMMCAWVLIIVSFLLILVIK